MSIPSEIRERIEQEARYVRFIYLSDNDVIAMIDWLHHLRKANAFGFSDEVRMELILKELEAHRDAGILP